MPRAAKRFRRPAPTSLRFRTRIAAGQAQNMLQSSISMTKSKSYCELICWLLPRRLCAWANNHFTLEIASGAAMSLPLKDNVHEHIIRRGSSRMAKCGRSKAKREQEPPQSPTEQDRTKPCLRARKSDKRRPSRRDKAQSETRSNPKIARTRNCHRRSAPTRQAKCDAVRVAKHERALEHPLNHAYSKTKVFGEIYLDKT